jgi:arsenical pump membrane protein
VLTPAVAAAARAARVEKPMPFLLVCAFVANAASFVLPISNPANLVVYGRDMPRLGAWLAQFAIPSVVAIVATYAVLRFVYRRDLAGAVAADVPLPVLSRGAILASLGIGATAVGLMAASALGYGLGWPTALAGIVTFLAVVVAGHASASAMIRDVSWGVLLLVAGLFVLVEALERSGALRPLVGWVEGIARLSPSIGGMVIGFATAVGCNLINNLPAGLIAGTTAQAASLPPNVHAAALIGVDLGPNLSVTGSLATILWLSALRREGHVLGAWPFLKLGLVAMPMALLPALLIVSLF